MRTEPVLTKFVQDWLDNEIEIGSEDITEAVATARNYVELKLWIMAIVERAIDFDKISREIWNRRR